MSVLLRMGPMLSFSASRGFRLVSASAAVMLAGCSADITRFDNSNFSLGDNGQSRRTAGGPVLDKPAGLTSTPPAALSQTSRSSGSEVASLPPMIEPVQPAPAAPPVRALAVTRAPAPAVAQPAPASAQVPRGQQIEVQQGDTLFGLSKRHNVLVSDLMAVNGLRNPGLKPGQKLFLPATAGVRATPQIKPERTAAAKAGPAPSAASVAASTTAPAEPEASAATAGTYTVRPGDSLYAIAARHKIKVLDLQRANDITDAAKVKPGTVLKLPSGGLASGGAAVAQGAAPLAGETVQPETRIVRVGSAAPQSSAGLGVKVLNGGDPAPARVAAAEPASATANDASPAAAPTGSGASGKLRWPVRGRVVQGFGPRSDGSHNDGVDIAVPAGTDVLAAEGGVVAYAGNEVKTYGNLVLIRHDNGWVTAYAYNEKLLVQRGDRVRRGQPVAKAGKSGGAEQPQLHFEVRVGSKPVDPSGYLEKL